MRQRRQRLFLFFSFLSSFPTLLYYQKKHSCFHTNIVSWKALRLPRHLVTLHSHTSLSLVIVLNIFSTQLVSTMPSRRHRYLTPFIDYLALIYAYIRTMLSIPLRTQQRIAFGKTTTTRAKPNNNHTKRTALQYYKGKTVVLDLDETLVHSVQLGGGKLQTVHAAIQRKQIEVQSNKQSILYLVYKRPHADFFLKTVRGVYKRELTVIIECFALCVLDKPMVQGGHLYSINGRICRPGDRLA